MARTRSENRMKTKKKSEHSHMADSTGSHSKKALTRDNTGGYSTKIPDDLINDLNGMAADPGRPATTDDVKELPLPVEELPVPIEDLPVQVEEHSKSGILKKLESAQKEIDRLKTENESLQENKLRLQADNENYRKRVSREKEDLQKYAAESLLREFLPVADNMEKALEHMNRTDNVETLKTGVEMTYKSFLNVLKNKGVTPYESLGKPFDPNLHEAIQTSPSEVIPAGCVSAVIRRGYMLSDRLLRASMVVVSTGPADSSGNTGVNPEDNKDSVVNA